jgi:CheY-like chemotaxis protein
MRILLADDEPAKLSGMSTRLKRLGHEVVEYSSGEDALKISDSELERIDVAVLDQKMFEVDGLTTGRELKQRRPSLYLIMLTAYGTVENAVQAFRDSQFNDYLTKPVNEDVLELAFSRARTVVDLVRENEGLRHDKDISQELRSHALFKNTHQVLAGVDGFLLGVFRAIEPFSLWLEGPRGDMPEELLPQFVTGLLFEGSPGAGKTVLCEAIASSFDSADTILSKELGPAEHPGGWIQPLQQRMTELYQRARERRVVVIRADDLVFPATAGMERSMAAEWERYMRAITDYVEDAGRINEGGRPQSSNLRGVSFSGKILWLFARNMTDDVGEMFGPLRDRLIDLKMDFPQDAESRKQILNLHARKNDCSFDPDALKLAVEKLASYGARDLVGDSKAKKGFIIEVTNQVKARERQRFDRHHDRSKVKLNITVKEVQDWLRGSQHKSVISHAPSSSGRRKVYGDGLDGQRVTLDMVEEMLSQRKPVNEIAAALSTSGPGRTVFNNFFKRQDIIKVFHETPKEDVEDRYPFILRRLSERHRSILESHNYPRWIMSHTA